MPLRRKSDAEIARMGLAADIRASGALRPHRLTQELLDWGLAALEAVISTPELQTLARARQKQSLLDAYKQLDHLYPLTLEVKRQSQLWELEHRDTGVDSGVQGVETVAVSERLGVVPLPGTQEPGGGDEADGAAGGPLPEMW